MKVLLLSKACVVGIYQRKLEELAAHGVELTVAVPPEWRDERGVQPLERTYTRGYQLVETPIALNGNFHLHFYPRFGDLLKRIQPDLVHIDEEPYNLATWLALRQSLRVGAKTLFFSWQNINRRYPFPFSWLERDVLKQAHGAIAGNAASAEVWRAKGFGGPLTVIPQFGVDAEIFREQGLGITPVTRHPPLVVGYAGRLVPEKGVDVLLLAAVRVPGVHVKIMGAGPERGLLENLVKQNGLSGRVSFAPMRPSTAMPSFYAELDALVLPSRTRPNWKEQFGRVLIEAMACGVPVIGSNCGEIPNVIGDSGLIFPEENAEALAAHLTALRESQPLRAELAAKGRARVLAHFAQASVAERTVAFYRQIVDW
jgi:glycosyltransferase involved in cell wall biosynthesis